MHSGRNSTLYGLKRSRQDESKDISRSMGGSHSGADATREDKLTIISLGPSLPGWTPKPDPPLPPDPSPFPGPPLPEPTPTPEPPPPPDPSPFPGPPPHMRSARLPYTGPRLKQRTSVGVGGAAWPHIVSLVEMTPCPQRLSKSVELSGSLPKG